MSDIAIRFDGLLLGLLILAGAGIFVAIALIAALRTLLTKPAGERSWKVMSGSLWLALAHVVALSMLLAWINGDGSARTGPDWIDWLAVPWSCFMLTGLVLLVRQSRVNRRRLARTLRR